MNDSQCYFPGRELLAVLCKFGVNFSLGLFCFVVFHLFFILSTSTFKIIFEMLPYLLSLCSLYTWVQFLLKGQLMLNSPDSQKNSLCMSSTAFVCFSGLSALPCAAEACAQSWGENGIPHDDTAFARRRKPTAAFFK